VAEVVQCVLVLAKQNKLKADGLMYMTATPAFRVNIVEDVSAQICHSATFSYLVYLYTHPD